MNATIIFCKKCRSELVDLRCWTGPETCTIACTNCGNVAELSGFTLGRADVHQSRIDEAQADAVFVPRLVGAEVSR